MFGSHEYSREELVAEMGAAFLAGHCGIETATRPEAASYIAGWLRTLNGDKAHGRSGGCAGAEGRRPNPRPAARG